MGTLIRKRPRSFVFLAIVTVAAIVSAFVLRAGSPVHATSGGTPYGVPLVVDANPAPNIVETTIVADEATVDIGGGVMANGQTFNGQIPGPTFQLEVGDTVIVHYVNALSRVSGIHWHGIELSNTMDGTPFTQNQVPPGGSFLYKFTVTRPGIYWYHPHHHSSTNQVFKGLYGMILVTDPNEAPLITAGTLPGSAATVPVVLSDTTVCKAPGSNDTVTYNPSLPWVGGGALPAQLSPTPATLCQGTPVDEDGNATGPFAAGDIPNIQLNTGGRTNEGQTVLTNGMNVGGRAGNPSAPGALAGGGMTMNVQPGQGLRLQIVNAATIRYMRLRLTTSAGSLVNLVRVGGEGGLLNNAVVEGGLINPGPFDTKYSQGEIVLPPGSRADVVAAIPASATGVLTMWTEDYSRSGNGFSNLPTVPVMHLQVAGPAVPQFVIGNGTPLRAATGDPVPVLGAPTGSLLNPATFVPPKPGMSSQDIQLGMVGPLLGIDGVFGTHDVAPPYTSAAHLGSTRYATIGDTLQLTVTNTTGAHHPFHLHGFSMQPLSLTKAASPTFTWPYPEFRDNIDVPAGYTLTYRIKLDDRPLADGTTMGGGLGRWVFHCHIFFHATLGMLGELVVTSANGNEKPDINANSVLTVVSQGATATMTGTFVDPDGDPMTLSSSIGTMTDNLNGTWSWSYPTPGFDASQLVYVTAMDAGGRKDQAVFQMLMRQGKTNLVLSKEHVGVHLEVGQKVTFTIQVSNHGADPAVGLHVLDELSPSLTYVSHTGPRALLCTTPVHGISGPIDCKLDVLQPAASFTLTLVARSVRTGPIANTASVTSGSIETEPGDELDTDFVSVLTNSKGCTMVGTRGADDLTGTDGPDVICGLAGADHIDGAGGADRLIGQSGADTLVDHSGLDALFGGPGSDHLDAADGTGGDFVDGQGGFFDTCARDAADPANGTAGDTAAHCP